MNECVRERERGQEWKVKSSNNFANEEYLDDEYSTFAMFAIRLVNYNHFFPMIPAYTNPLTLIFIIYLHGIHLVEFSEPRAAKYVYMSCMYAVCMFVTMEIKTV